MGGEYCLHDIVVACATAKVTLKFVADCFFIEAIRITFHDTYRTHYHARCAKSALKCMILPEGLLHWVKSITISKSLYRGYVGVFRLPR